jgi:hypothetical protein
MEVKKELLRLGLSLVQVLKGRISGMEGPKARAHVRDGLVPRGTQARACARGGRVWRACRRGPSTSTFCTCLAPVTLVRTALGARNKCGGCPARTTLHAEVAGECARAPLSVRRSVRHLAAISTPNLGPSVEQCDRESALDRRAHGRFGPEARWISRTALDKHAHSAVRLVAVARRLQVVAARAGRQLGACSRRRWGTLSVPCKVAAAHPRRPLLGRAAVSVVDDLAPQSPKAGLCAHMDACARRWMSAHAAIDRGQPVTAAATAAAPAPCVVLQS